MGNGAKWITVEGVAVEVIRKRVKHLRLTVSPPDGRVRISVPTQVDDEAVRAMIGARLDWIHRHQARQRSHVRPPAPAFVTGEWHDVDGVPCQLQVTEVAGRASVTLVGTRLELRVAAGSDRDRVAGFLDAWYRARLRERATALVAAWEPRMGVTVRELRIRRMTTRWGSCNTQAGRIWLTLELARRSPSCLEYILVHEMVHLLERRHDARFYRLMDQFLPTWRASRDELNRATVPRVS